MQFYPAIKAEIIVSLHSKHAVNIVNGVKPLEVRKRKFPNAPATRAFLYATRPVGRVIGECTILPWMFHGNASRIVRQGYLDGLCITEEELKWYLDGREGYVYRIADPIKYESPVELSYFGIPAPPSWNYVKWCPA